MDCDLTSIDQFFIEKCAQAEYCVLNEKPNGTEYIIRVGDRIYVMIIPETT